MRLKIRKLRTKVDDQSELIPQSVVGVTIVSLLRVQVMDNGGGQSRCPKLLEGFITVHITLPILIRTN